MREFTERWPTTLTIIMFFLMLMAVIISRRARTRRQYMGGLACILAALLTSIAAIIVHTVRGVAEPYRGMQDFYGRWTYWAVLIAFIATYRIFFLRRSRSDFAT